MSLKGEAHKRGHKKIPMKSLLVDIIDIDTKNLTVKVEPLVNMGQLSRNLTSRLHIAGAAGIGRVDGWWFADGVRIQSSSHVYGLFQETCPSTKSSWVTVVYARENNEHADLFRALPWSYGTIGLLVSAT